MSIISALLFLGLGAIVTAIVFEDDAVDALDCAFLGCLAAIVLAVWSFLTNNPNP